MLGHSSDNPAGWIFTLPNDEFPIGHYMKICASELGQSLTPCDIVHIIGNIDSTYNWDFNANHQPPNTPFPDANPTNIDTNTNPCIGNCHPGITGGNPNQELHPSIIH